jgi:hypothetical protein
VQPAGRRGGATRPSATGVDPAFKGQLARVRAGSTFEEAPSRRKMSSSSSAHPANAQPSISKRTRSTLPDQTPNKQARVSASPAALDGVRRLQKVLPRRLNITSPRCGDRKVRASLAMHLQVVQRCAVDPSS